MLGSRFLSILIISLICLSCSNIKESDRKDHSSLNFQDFIAIKDANKGKIFITYIFASWCKPCAEVVSEYIDFFNESDKDKVTLIGISIDSKVQALSDFVDKNQINYDVFLASRDLQNKLNVHFVPLTIIYNSDGVLATSVPGPINKEQLTNFIRSLKD